MRQNYHFQNYLGLWNNGLVTFLVVLLSFFFPPCTFFSPLAFPILYHCLHFCIKVNLCGRFTFGDTDDQSLKSQNGTMSQKTNINIKNYSWFIMSDLTEGVFLCVWVLRYALIQKGKHWHFASIMSIYFYWGRKISLYCWAYVQV